MLEDDSWQGPANSKRLKVHHAGMCGKEAPRSLTELHDSVSYGNFEQLASSRFGDLYESFSTKVQQGIDLGTEQSGLFTAEDACDHLRQSMVALGTPLGADIRCVKAGDNSRSSLTIYNGYDGHMKPECFFDDVMDRMDETTREQLNICVEEGKDSIKFALKNVTTDKQKDEVRKECAKDLGRQCAAVLDAMRTKMSVDTTAMCKAHGKHCPLFRSLHADTKHEKRRLQIRAVG